MKKVVLAGLLTVGLAASASAYDTRVVTGINNTDGASIQTYHNIGLGSSQLILGMKTGIPSTSDKDRGLSLSGNIGLTVDTDLPVLSNFEISADFGKDETGDLWVGKNLMIVKKYTVKLADKIDIGLSATLLNVDFDGETVTVLGTVAPVIAMNVKI
jgi:hypothetical protein